MPHEKRVVPGTLKSILDWDVKITTDFVKYVDQKFGPLANYKNLFKRLEISCHGIPWLIGTAVLTFLISNQFCRSLCVNLLIVLLLDIVVVAIVKALVRRRRPAVNDNDKAFTLGPDKFSFPSGHVTRAVMLALLLTLKYEIFLPFLLLFYVWSGSVCLSRVLMRRHFILDTVGGFVIGLVEALLFANFFWLSDDSVEGVVGFFLDETRVGASYDV